MGPPHDSYFEGRYDSPGEIALYLCDSEEGVKREVLQDMKSGKKLFLQEYLIDFNELNVANFSDSDLSNFVKTVFDIAENCKISDRNGLSSYIFSQTVAKLVRMADFNGMIVLGVRGDRSFHYKNVVIYKHDQWEKWSRKENGFRYFLYTV